MGRLPLLVGLALHELWISFRLVAMLVLLLAATFPIFAVPRTATAALADAPPGPLTWYAAASALAFAACGGIAAWSIADMRRRGTVAWLAVRAVPRSGVLAAWFVALAGVTLAGSLLASFLAWTALGGESGVLATTAGYAAIATAMAVGGVVAVATGLVLGVLLPKLPAAALALLVVGATGLAIALGAAGTAAEPLAGLALLAHIELDGRPIASGTVATGLALALSALLLLAASAALERRDL